MNMSYSRDLKKLLCINICFNGKSTSAIANQYNIPIKTLEKWITAFNKDNHCFDPVTQTSTNFNLIDNNDSINYDELSNEELKKEIMKKDIEICRLKKGYTVKEGGMGRKVFVTFSKKNTK